MEVRSLLRNTTPLCFMPNGNLVCYKNGVLGVLRNKKIEKRCSVPINGMERFLAWSPYAVRFLRFGIRAAIALDNENIVFSRGHALFEVNLQTGELSKGWCCGEGVRPLIFTDLKGIKDFDDGIYFGGYVINMDKKPVNVYKRIDIDKWEVAYSFEKGSINHVHNVVPDPYRNCVWIFTGDFDESAAIWKATNNFQKVERVACNDQKYRGCVVFVLPEGLLYATDAPFAEDYIYLLDPETMKTKEILPIHGSCIYGCKWKNEYVFSSTVEGDGRDESFVGKFFCRKRGAGIKDEFVHLYVGDLSKGFKDVYRGEKDSLPFLLFQFGVFKFPAGDNPSDTLYFQPMATKKNDLDLMEIVL